MTGKIKKVVQERGFGFIKPQDGSGDIFFHLSGLQKPLQIEELREGDHVSFATKDGNKGLQAVQVQKIA